MARSEGPLDPAWRDFRRRWWLMFGLTIGFIPGVALLARPLLDRYDSPAVVLVVGVPWMAVWAWANSRLAQFPCPSCGRSFVAKGPRRQGMNQFTSRCVHCGLPKWQTPPQPRARRTRPLGF